MPQFTVPLAGGGAMTVNASDQQAALDNVSAQGGTPAGGGAIAGGHMLGGPGHPQNQPGQSFGQQQSTTGDAGQLATGIDQMLAAIASGNKAAFDEAIRQFNVTFGLDQQKFGEAVRQFNEGLGITQAGVTGQYQGAPTLPAMTGYANQFGTWGVPQQGQSTLAAQNQAYTQQMGAIQAAAALQANPFRQQQVLGQLGQVLGGGGVAGFQAPNTVQGVGTAGGNQRGGMGYLSQLIQDIRDPSPNSASMNSVLQGIPTPAKINSVEFLRAAPSTQSLVLQGMTERYGLQPQDALAQIKATLPGFSTPTTMGTIKR